MAFDGVTRIGMFDDLMRDALATSNVTAYTRCLERVAKLAREHAESLISDPIDREMAVQRCLKLMHKKRLTFTRDRTFDEWALAILEYSLSTEVAGANAVEPLLHVPARA